MQIHIPSLIRCLLVSIRLKVLQEALFFSYFQLESLILCILLPTLQTKFRQRLYLHPFFSSIEGIIY